MPRYSALVTALQQQRTVKKVDLVRLDFASRTMFVWDGFGALATLDPGAPNPATAPQLTWQGLGQLASISDIEMALVSSSAPTLSLSGVDAAVLGEALNASHEVKGRPCRIFEQYFDADTSALIDVPVIRYAGVMDRMTVADAGPNQRTVTLKLVTLLYRRRRPALAYLSDATQKALHPGDNGAEQVPALVHRDRPWP